MDRISVSTNFFLDELVDPQTYFKTTDKGLSTVDRRVVNYVQLLRDFLGKPLRINNWWQTAVKMIAAGKTIDEVIAYIKDSDLSKWSGLRPDYCTVGAKKGMHRLQSNMKFGAADPKGDEWAMFDVVRRNAKRFYDAGLRRLEDPRITDGWLHGDVSESGHKAGHIRVIDLDSLEFYIRVSDGAIVEINPETKRSWPQGFKFEL